MNQINQSCLEKLNKAFPEHVQELFSKLTELANQLDNPNQEICIWWGPEDVQDGDLIPSITFRLTPIERGTDAKTDS